MSLNAYERETTMISTDGDDNVVIWSAQRKYIHKMRKNARFTLLREGEHEGSIWAEFSIPKEHWNPATGAKRQNNMTDEQRKAAAERLRRVRNDD